MEYLYYNDPQLYYLYNDLAPYKPSNSEAEKNLFTLSIAHFPIQSGKLMFYQCMRHDRKVPQCTQIPYR